MNRKERRATHAKDRKRIRFDSTWAHHDGTTSANFVEAIVGEAMPMLCARGAQWTGSMGRALSELAFIIAHKSSTTMMDEIRAMDRDDGGILELEESYAVMTATREHVAKWCVHFGLDDFVSPIGTDPTHVPVVVMYEMRATLAWITPTGDGHWS